MVQFLLIQLIVYRNLDVVFYYLNEDPDEEIAKKQVKVETKPKLPFSRNQDTQNQDTYNTNRTNINSSNTNSININSHSFYQEQENLDTVDKDHMEEKELTIKEIERLNLNKLKEIIYDRKIL